MFSPARRQGCIVCLFALTSRLCMTGATRAFWTGLTQSLWNFYKMKRSVGGNIAVCNKPKQTQPLPQSKPYLLLWCDRFPDYGPVRGAQIVQMHQADWTLVAEDTGAATYESISSTFACKRCWSMLGSVKSAQSFTGHTTPFSSRDWRWMLLALGAGGFPYKVPSQYFWTWDKAWYYNVLHAMSFSSFSKVYFFSFFLSLSLSLSLSFLTRENAAAPGPVAAPLSAWGRSTWPDSINVGWSIAQCPWWCTSSTCTQTCVCTYIYIHVCVCVCLCAWV